MAGLVINKNCSSDTQEEDNNSRKEMLKVKLENQETGVLVTSGVQKRKRLPRGRAKGVKSGRFAEPREGTIEGQKNKQIGSSTRWSVERYKFAEQALVEVMREKRASFESPISRYELRNTARKKIGDTGLLDHLLKHIDGEVTPGGTDRFRRCYNTDGAMEYWLESADLVKIKREAGIPDPNWIPPSWWKTESASHESTVSNLLREEIEKMKSDIKELVSKQKLPHQADATEKLRKDFTSWRVKTDKQIVEISNSLTSTQCMFKELITWKEKVEQQLVGLSNSLNNLQANGSTSFSPAPESWENILQNAKLDDLTGNGFEPWVVNDDLIDALPEAVGQDRYSFPPKPCKSPFQHHIWFEEQSFPNFGMQMTERGESRSSNQDKADMTPGSSMTAGAKSDFEDTIVYSQETLKELMTWKAKAEQQLTEISNAVVVLQEQSPTNWLYP